MIRITLLLLALIGGSAAGARPNILFIVSEDNGPELGCYGDANALANNISPTLDQLARDGVMFENAFVPYSVCSPSRACFYTGTHVAQNGHEGLATHKFAMHAGYPSFYKLLKESGYRTGLIGKLHINPGSVVSAHVDFRAITGANFGQSGRNMRNYATQAKKFITGDYADAKVAEPILLTVNFPDAHLPMHHLAPTGNTADADTLPKDPVTADDVQTIPWVGVTSERLRDQTAGYYNCLRRLDDGIAMILADLDAAGLNDDTLVIYIGDHGAQFSRGKTSVYEAGLRVPMIVRWPGSTADLPGEFNARTELVSTLDIMPTMLAAAGADIPNRCSGFPLQPLLEGKQVPWRRYIFGHTTGSAPSLNYLQLSVRDERFKLISNPFKEPTMPKSLQELSNRCATAYLGGQSHFYAGSSQAEIDAASTAQLVKDAYARYLTPPRYELYDLKADPYEWTNLADDPDLTATRERLIQALAAWQSDPIIADPWASLDNVQRFGTMQEDAIGTNYRSKGGFVWDYLDPASGWNYGAWIAEHFPTFTAPVIPTDYAMGFEQADGFTFPTEGDFLLFPADSVTDTKGGIWSGDGTTSGIWNRFDLPPEGVQALRVGTDSGESSVEVTLPDTVTKIGTLSFAYANYSQSTDCTGRVLLRPQDSEKWETVWEQDFTGLQVDWKIKPWPIVSLPLDRIDGPFELRFESDGEKGMKFDQLELRENALPVMQDYAAWRAAEFAGAAASDDLISGPSADPDSDRLTNLMEFLFKQSPLVANEWLDEFQLGDDGYLRLKFSRNVHASGGSTHLEISADLEQWIPIGRERVIAQDENGCQTIEVAIPPLESDSQFLRIRAVATISAEKGAKN